MAFGAELPCWVSEHKAGSRGGKRILWKSFLRQQTKWSGVGRRARPRGVIKCAVSLGPVTQHAGPGSVRELWCPSFVISQTVCSRMGVIWPVVGSDRGTKDIRGSQTNAQVPGGHAQGAFSLGVLR